MTASGPTAAAAPGASALSTAAGQSPLPGAGSLRPLGAGSGAWVPTEAIACHRPVVPAVPRRKWLAMIPWLLEDQLLEPVERLHFACGERGADGAVAVLVVNSEQLVRWRRDAAGPLVPDGFALPWAQGECVLAVDGDRWRDRRPCWRRWFHGCWRTAPWSWWSTVGRALMSSLGIWPAALAGATRRGSLTVPASRFWPSGMNRRSVARCRPYPVMPGWRRALPPWRRC